MSEISYKDAGVDIAAGNEAVDRIKAKVQSTFSPDVLSSLGGFAACYDLKTLINQYKHPVLVQSIDGVGTKVMVAKQMQKFTSLGADLLSATCNDIVVIGAKPLTLLDYIANDRLDPAIIEEIVTGIVEACKAHHVSLVGGETAEMPGVYQAGEHDMVGVITGVVEKDHIITGEHIASGQHVYGFASSGMHTNGFSLARKVLFDHAGLTVTSTLPTLPASLGDVLLAPHINYTNPILALMAADVSITGMAHITGGGLLENIPRVLPHGCAVHLNREAWPELPIFSVLRELSGLGDQELYRTLNMGIGFVVISDAPLQALQTVVKAYPEYSLYEIGEVIAGDTGVVIR